MVINGDFETGDLTGWIIDGFNNAPYVQSSVVHSGTYALRLGNFSSEPEPSGDSSVYQEITVPSEGGILSFWHWDFSDDSIYWDWQDAYITDTNGHILVTIFHQCNSSQTWIQQKYNLSVFAGQTVRIKFLVHQDGAGDATGMYIDDVFIYQPVAGAIVVTPSTNTIGSLGAKTLTATVYDQNSDPMSGINITWGVSDNTIGTVSPISGITDINGNTSTVFTSSGKIGTTNVIATSSTGSGGASIIIYQPVVGSISVSPITATTCTMLNPVFTAKAYDQYNTIMTGANITWRVDNSAIGTPSITSGITDTSGKTITTFISSNPGTTNITASSGSISGTSSVTVAAKAPIVNGSFNTNLSGWTFSGGNGGARWESTIGGGGRAHLWAYGGYYGRWYYSYLTSTQPILIDNPILKFDLTNTGGGSGTNAGLYVIVGGSTIASYLGASGTNVTIDLSRYRCQYLTLQFRAAYMYYPGWGTSDYELYIDNISLVPGIIFDPICSDTGSSCSADLYLNNVYQGTTPITIVNVGTYAYKIVKEGYYDVSDTVSITGSLTTSILLPAAPLILRPIQTDNIINGTFDTDLNGWYTNTGVTWDNKRAKLNYNGRLSQSFKVATKPYLIFDWKSIGYLGTDSGLGYQIYVDNVLIIDKRLPGNGGLPLSGQEKVDLTNYIGRTVKLVFYEAYNWTGWIDNVLLLESYNCTSIILDADTTSTYIGDIITLTANINPSNLSINVEFKEGDTSLGIINNIKGQTILKWDTSSNPPYFTQPSGVHHITANSGSCTSSIDITLNDVTVYGSLEIMSHPQSSIIIDGNDIGQLTPAKLSITQGPHSIALRTAGISDYSTIVDIAPGSTETISAVLEESIFFKTKPAGAKIIVDSIDSGKITPDVITSLSLGTHGYSLILDGKIISDNVQLLQGQGVEIDKQFEPLKNGTFDTDLTGWTTAGSVAWNSNNSAHLSANNGSSSMSQTFIIGSSLSFDWSANNVDAGFMTAGYSLYITSTGESLASGTFGYGSGSVLVDLKGYEGIEATISFSVASYFYYGISLTIDLFIGNIILGDIGSISLTTYPSGANIVANGKTLLYPNGSNKTTPNTIYLPAGDYDIALEYTGLNDFVKILYLNANESYTISAIFEGCVYFTTTPPGANIFINGKNTRKVTPNTACTPCISILGPTDYALILDSYEPVYGCINLLKGEGTTIDVTLNPLPSPLPATVTTYNISSSDELQYYFPGMKTFHYGVTWDQIIFSKLITEKYVGSIRITWLTQASYTGMYSWIALNGTPITGDHFDMNGGWLSYDITEDINVSLSPGDEIQLVAKGLGFPATEWWSAGELRLSYACTPPCISKTCASTCIKCIFVRDEGIYSKDRYCYLGEGIFTKKT